MRPTVGASRHQRRVRERESASLSHPATFRSAPSDFRPGSRTRMRGAGARFGERPRNGRYASRGRRDARALTATASQDRAEQRVRPRRPRRRSQRCAREGNPVPPRTRRPSPVRVLDSLALPRARRRAMALGRGHDRGEAALQIFSRRGAEAQRRRAPTRPRAPSLRLRASARVNSAAPPKALSPPVSPHAAAPARSCLAPPASGSS
jgi:hypothetical protein